MDHHKMNFCDILELYFPHNPYNCPCRWAICKASLSLAIKMSSSVADPCFLKGGFNSWQKHQPSSSWRPKNGHQPSYSSLSNMWCIFNCIISNRTTVIKYLGLTALLEYFNYQHSNQFQKGVSVETLKPPWIRHCSLLTSAPCRAIWLHNISNHISNSVMIGVQCYTSEICDLIWKISPNVTFYNSNIYIQNEKWELPINLTVVTICSSHFELPETNWKCF